MDSENEQFIRIYDQYIDKIYRFVYLKVNSQEIAEDITSKVFLKGWENYRGEPKKIENMSAFLYQIARNSIVDHYREKSKTKIVSTDFASKIADSKVNLYEKAVLKEGIETVKLAIANLKKDYQDVIIWHYLEDMPPLEIAAILNKPVGTIRVMIHRGLNSLKSELIDEA
ncbi:MAG: RNA polymerase, sigma-24 subunit, ECF subfamily [Parcubacteria group bacterium GW2011_GWA1_33_6]|uniref:RNA polymerase sigma factor n=1 Tax=Candidatus Staskawiczbacteria bacterium RIFCSPHIGHO2_02_FULL_33_16 TaxID=1802204 RepID=A0A1G2HW68_9BACT|nr:MAG: RNA polymerase, sigma-24 subunit, ECF subfamily [Parcubacteria group bacterium GW2011_GWA1_33_6]OGZ66649.1 MAG: hypothetical protein A3D34_00095 [Candidatus Staskawiczbacteria bacterium RIFCSPHIGHO2_02_FULL_33_16]OGZ69927.1 MAG: hypothetical protein A2980_03345 [Candidatus Staskawiczbacteria bacterium RIFCSPLOWO2_01_FULL_33_13]